MVGIAFQRTCRFEPFDAAIAENFQLNEKLRPVPDRGSLENKEGVYVIVLGGRRQAYSGRAYDIRHHIKRHRNGPGCSTARPAMPRRGGNESFWHVVPAGPDPCSAGGEVRAGLA